jgi:hypothetical protein
MAPDSLFKSADRRFESGWWSKEIKQNLDFSAIGLVSFGSWVAHGYQRVMAPNRKRSQLSVDRKVDRQG